MMELVSSLAIIVIAILVIMLITMLISYLISKYIFMDNELSKLKTEACVKDEVIQNLMTSGHQIKITSPMLNPFTKRELELAQYVTDGLTNKEIAEKLNLSPFTINNHIDNMKEKSNSKNKAELVSFIVKNELC